LLGTAEIIDLATERRTEFSSALVGMERVRQVYDRENLIDLPEVEGLTSPAVPNLLAQGVDQMAGRIASTLPQINVRPRTDSRRETRRAATAARVLGGWWAENDMPLRLVRRARHLTAYGATTCVLSWDAKNKRPQWKVRSPLNAYPAIDYNEDSATPRDIIFRYVMSAGQLRNAGYGQQVDIVTANMEPRTDSTLLDVIEYISAEQSTMILEGIDHLGNRNTAVLEHVHHRLGITPVTYAKRIGLESLNGQFDQMIGMYEAQALMMALDLIAVQKGIFPDTYLESRPNEIAQFIEGPYDGRTGKVNIVAGGSIREIQSSPGYLTNPTIDRLERNQRVDAGIPAEFGGESGSNLRTGRRGDAVLSATIDMPIAYAQGLIAQALEAENEIAARLALRYDRDAQRTLRKGLGNDARPVTFVAGIVFADDLVSQVSYPAAGSDMNALIIGIGQRVGMGLMSRQTAATLDPFVENAEAEKDRIVAEGLEQALLSGLQQQAAAGAIPPDTLARIIHLVESDKLELPAAVQRAQEEAMKEMQEQEQPSPGAGPAAAALSGNPEAMSAVPGLGPSADDLTSLLTQLRMPVMGVEPRVGAQPDGSVRV
jgi:hypothetical protein